MHEQYLKIIDNLLVINIIVQYILYIILCVSDITSVGLHQNFEPFKLVVP